MGRNENMMAEINAKISTVVHINFSLNLEIDSPGTKLANMTSVAKSLSQAVTDLHDRKHKLQEEINRWAMLSADHYQMQNDTRTLIDLLWKDCQLLQNQCNNLRNDLARIIKKRMKDANSVARSDLPLAFNMVNELESDLDSAVANNKALLKQLQELQAQHPV
jgi:DNA repair exonuclease SbcCD ATPase subunit